MFKTYAAKPSEITKNWWLIDAEDLIVGRVSTIIANILRGKNKPQFSPNLDCGDNVIVINAEKVKFTGKKYAEKKYYSHTGHPGGIKEKTARQILEGGKPEDILRKSVARMISRGPLQRDLMAKLHIYQGPDHKHEAQKPEVLDVASMNRKNKKTN